MIKDILEPSEFEVAYGKYLEDNREYVISINPLVLSVFIALQGFRQLIDCAQNGYHDLLTPHFIIAVAHAKQIDKYRSLFITNPHALIIDNLLFPSNCCILDMIDKIHLVSKKDPDISRWDLVGLEERLREAIDRGELLEMISNFKNNLDCILEDLMCYNPHVEIFCIPECWEIANSRYMVPNY